MDSMISFPSALLELFVMIFQVLGVGSLTFSRLLPGSAWAGRARGVFVVALVGLGLCGAFCGQHDSQFALFAGVTITVLLIGMIAGAGTTGPTTRSHRVASRATSLAG